MTNYERIKAMEFEEMREFLDKTANGYINFARTDCAICDRSWDECDDCTRLWLNNDSKHSQGIDY